MKQRKRNIIRGLFLIAFIALWMIGKIQLWGQLLFLGLLVIPLLGRIYCGYVCPISTTIDTISIIRPPHPSSEKHEKFFFNNKVRSVTFLVSIILLVTFIKTNFVIPFFAFLIPVGVVFTYLFGEAAWHRNCFIGIVYSWLGGLSRKGYFIEDSFCTGCGICKNTCPTGSLEVNPLGKSKIDKKYCILCGNCREVCPSNNIVYGNLKNTRKKSGKQAVKGEITR